ncbi:MAG: DUF2029 domain-containing protein [Cyanobacteria bacterium REEB67]|nr:DUF2029 domain-containing protein [Cyanobacteria bacterium REEB67]
MSTFKLPPLWQQCLIFWALLCLIIIGFTDTMPQILAISDYLMTFHTAGFIAAHGLWNVLYPPEGTLSFAGAPFDKQAHALLPFMPASSVAEYMYMPLSAYIFAPFSLLAPAYSMVAWQLTCLAATYWGNFLTLGNRRRALLASAAAFAFLPFTLTVWIGQVGLVFGLLPLAAGCYLFKKEQYFFGGLTLALLSLKPQMLVPAVFLLIFQLGRKRFAPLAALITGTALIAQFNYNLAGQTIFTAWMRCLALSDKIYSDPAQGVAVHLATSLPRAIVLSQPPASHGAIKPLVYALAAALLLAGLFAVLNLARSKSDISEGERLKFTFVLGALALPIVVPHLFIYDLGALVPAAFSIFFEEPESEAGKRIQPGLKKILLAFWLIVSGYCLTLVINKDLAQPLVLVALMLGCYMSAVISLLRPPKQV